MNLRRAISHVFSRCFWRLHTNKCFVFCIAQVQSQHGKQFRKQLRKQFAKQPGKQIRKQIRKQPSTHFPKYETTKETPKLRKHMQQEGRGKNAKEWAQRAESKERKARERKPVKNLSYAKSIFNDQLCLSWRCWCCRLLTPQLLSGSWCIVGHGLGWFIH